MKSMVIAWVCAGALTVVGCADGRGIPTSPTAAPLGVGSSALSAFPRSGQLFVEKQCLDFEIDSSCTITFSSLEAIEVGSRIIYHQPAALGTPAGSDVTLDLPGPGNNSASGHCVLDPANNFFGRCTFSGGTGKFTWFSASVDVSHEDFLEWFWNGTYSFSPQD
jgi:hypothetical protein